MKVAYIVEGDIVRTMIQLKNRPAIVLHVDESKGVVTVCPLTTESPTQSNINCATTPALSKSRFLRYKSYYTFSTTQMALDDAKNNMVGLVDKRTLAAIKKNLRSDFDKKLKL